MKRLVVVECGVCWSLAIGSGGSSNGDRAMQELIKLMNEFADELESGLDQSQFNAMGAKIQESGKQFKALGLSEADAKQLTLKYEADLAKASTRLTSALANFENKELAALANLNLEGLLAQSK